MPLRQVGRLWRVASRTVDAFLMSVAGSHPRHEEAMRFLLDRIDYERISAVPYHAREFRLDRMRELLRRLGDPQRRLPIIHIAGTKGKGSTATILATICTAAGYRTGVFVSPHLDCLEERIAIDGATCSPEDLVNLVDQLRAVVEAMDRELAAGSASDGIARGPTYFELTTALALMHFARQRVQLAILEVGMGGRLDSTNVCQPICTAITNISFDHTKQLGNTLPAIAAEKAGIIKPGIPVISGALDAGASRVIAEVARRHGAPLLQLGVDFDFRYRPPRAADHSDAVGTMDYLPAGPAAGRPLGDLTLGMLGRHQAANSALALAIVSQLAPLGWPISEPAIRSGVRSARCGARIEILRRRPVVIVDAAHNVASARALLDVLRESFQASQRILVFASTEGKDLRGILSSLLADFDQVVLTRYRNNPRGVDVSVLEDIAADVSRQLPAGRCAARQCCDDPAAAWSVVRRLATPDSLVCITGSFFIAAEMRAIIALEARQGAEAWPVDPLLAAPGR